MLAVGSTSHVCACNGNAAHKQGPISTQTKEAPTRRGVGFKLFPVKEDVAHSLIVIASATTLGNDKGIARLQ